MNYFALAGAIVAGLIALRSVLVIITVATGKKRYADPDWGFTVNAVVTAVTGPLAAWLFSLALS